MEVKIRTPKVTDHLTVEIGNQARRVPIETFSPEELDEMAHEYGKALIKRRNELNPLGS